MSWYADECFWSGLREAIFDGERWASAQSEAANLLRLAGISAPGAVLDVPCGPGRHLVPLAALGHRVTGVDLSLSYLRRARARLDAEGLEAELIRADMRHFRRDRAFDLAVNLYTSFGYFEDARDDTRLLRQIRASLRPGGRLVLESLTRETVRGATGEERALTTASGMRVRTDWRLLDAGRVLERTFVAEHGSERREYRASHRLYSVPELFDLCAAAGLQPERAHGAFDGRPLDQTSTYAVLIARRR